MRPPTPCSAAELDCKFPRQTASSNFCNKIFPQKQGDGKSVLKGKLLSSCLAQQQTGCQTLGQAKLDGENRGRLAWSLHTPVIGAPACPGCCQRNGPRQTRHQSRPPSRVGDRRGRPQAGRVLRCKWQR